MSAQRPRRRHGLNAIGLAVLLAVGAAGCQGDDESPTRDPEGSGAPLFDEAIDPAESQSELDD